MNRGSKRPALFREEQRFRQPWLWALLAALTVIPTVVVVALALTSPVGSSAVTLGTAALIAASGALAMALFAALKLVTDVRDDAVYLRYSPFVNRRIPYDQIRTCAARRYRPLREYGGWGIRWGLRGTAYNVSGNWGVQLELTGGRRLLIGSQRADELARAIEAHMRPPGPGSDPR